jgi:hypothetical protein
VEILDGATALRVLQASSSSVTYTGAQQLSDRGALFGPGDALAIRIQQISVFGSGTPATVILQF